MITNSLEIVSRDTGLEAKTFCGHIFALPTVVQVDGGMKDAVPSEFTKYTICGHILALSVVIQLHEGL